MGTQAVRKNELN